MSENIDYRHISKIITQSDVPITFTGVRAIFLKAMQKMATEYIKEYSDTDVVTQKRFAHELSNSVDFQDAVGEHLYKLCSMKGPKC